MSNETPNQFAGREGVAVFLGIAGVGSAVFNVWGAYQITTDPVFAVVFAAIVTACEGIAFLSLRHIVRDWENRRYEKAKVASLALCLAIAGCFISGKRSFHMISVQAEAEYARLSQEHSTLEKVAKDAEAAYLAERTAWNATTWKNSLRSSTDKKVEMERAKPMSVAVMWLFLALFEVLKIGGLWAIATPTTKGLTRHQRRAAERTAKLKEAKADAEFRRKLAELDDVEEAMDEVGEKVVNLR